MISPGQVTSDLAIAASQRALAAAKKEQVDMVLVATTTPDQVCPAMAPVIADALGMSGVPAVDLSAACTGFLYGLSWADTAVRAGTCRSVLVIGAEAFTTLLDPADRTTRVIFGDGAGAAVVEAADTGDAGEILSIRLGSDGARAADICVASGGTRERQRVSNIDPYFRMNGRTVFLQAVLKMEEAARAVLIDAGWKTSELAGVVAHQANARIIRALAERLALPDGIAYMNIQDVGNTAAASIPIAMSDAQYSRAYEPGSPTLLAAYGGGATWGAAAIRWLARTVPYNKEEH